MFRQQVGPGEELDNTKWGTGSQDGFHTLLAYNAAMAKDGTVYAGLQDNGTIRVEPTGRQVGTFGFDGYGVAVDPDDSGIAYQTIQYGKLHSTVDGGHSWKSIDPGLTEAPFWTPFAMDPKDPNHLIAAGHDRRRPSTVPTRTPPTRPTYSTIL